MQRLGTLGGPGCKAEAEVKMDTVREAFCAWWNQQQQQQMGLALLAAAAAATYSYSYCWLINLARRHVMLDADRMAQARNCT